jgi:hypothetical protein
MGWRGGEVVRRGRDEERVGNRGGNRLSGRKIPDDSILVWT